jgi:hypothetical protein
MVSTWFAPMKIKNWRITKKNEIFGVSIGRSYLLDQVSINDNIAFYIYPPLHGIIALGKVISKPFVSDHDYYGENKYKYIIRLQFDTLNILTKDKIMPLHKLIGYYDAENDFIIEPYLRNVIFIELIEDAVTSLNSFFKQQ